MPTEISGSTGVNKIQDNTIVNADINSSAAIANSKLVGADGITDISEWNISDYSSSADLTLSSGWTGTTIKGSALTQSSGIFTFPSTGYWRIDLMGTFYKNDTSALNTENVSISAWLSTDGGSNFPSDASVVGHSNMDSPGDDWWRTQVMASVILDITNTSTHKVKFKSYVHGSTAIYFSLNSMNGGFIFTRLGDT